MLDQRNLDLNEGPTNFDRRHTVSLSGRVEVPWIRGLTASAVARMMSGQPVHHSQHEHRRQPQQRRQRSGGARHLQRRRPERVTVENKGGRNGAYGPGFLQIDLRAGYRMRLRQARTIDLFAEVFNLTNEANFANPSGDQGRRRPGAGVAGRRRIPASVPDRRANRSQATFADTLAASSVGAAFTVELRPAAGTAIDRDRTKSTADRSMSTTDQAARRRIASSISRDRAVVARRSLAEVPA